MELPVTSCRSLSKETLSSSREVWNALRKGDKRALSSLYEAFFTILYNYGRKFSSDSALTEDCIQELFIELWNKREALAEVHHVKYYLYKSLRRKIIHGLSEQSRLLKKAMAYTFEIELSHKSHYLNEQIDKEIRQRLGLVVAALSPKQKEALFLIYYDGLSYEEAASVMGLKIKTVYNLVHLAVSNLKEKKATLALLSLFL